MNPKIILEPNPSSQITCSTPSVSNEQELNVSSSSGFSSEYPDYSMNTNITGSSLSSRKVSTNDEFLDPNIQEELERIRRLPIALPKVGQEIDTLISSKEEDDDEFGVFSRESLRDILLRVHRDRLEQKKSEEKVVKDKLLSLEYLPKKYPSVDDSIVFLSKRLKVLNDLDLLRTFQEVFDKIKNCVDDLITGNSSNSVIFEECLNELVEIKNQLPKNPNYNFIENNIADFLNCIYLKITIHDMSTSLWVCNALTKVIFNNFCSLIEDSDRLSLHRAIVYAARCNEECALGVLRKLIEETDISSLYTDLKSNVAMHYAALLGNAKVIRLMIDRLNAMGPYELREGEEIKDCKYYVTRAYTMVNKFNQDGNTSLHCAVISGSLECVQLLLEAGAECELSNSRLQTPLEIARNLNFQDIAALIEETINKKAQDAYIASLRRKPLTEEERIKLVAIRREYAGIDSSMKQDLQFMAIAEKYKNVVIRPSRGKPLTEEERIKLGAIREQYAGVVPSSYKALTEEERARHKAIMEKIRV